MSTEDTIKAEMRLFALETFVCQMAATTFQSFPREFFDAAKKQAIEGAQKHVFPGFDAGYSDVISDEFQQALGRLYEMTQYHLDTVQRRQQR
jgi:hypothetical protein